MNILLCDNSVIDNELDDILKKLGHQIFNASDPIQAAEIFSKTQPELILLDLDLIDGYEIARSIRKLKDSWVPIIFISNIINDDIIDNAIKAGGDDFLLKPILPAMLKAKIYAMKHFIEVQATLIDYNNKLKEDNDKLLSANQVFSELSLKDPLTRLANRRSFEETLTKYCRTAIRENVPVCLLMIDIDNFKSVNDTYGYQTGDYCLQRIAQVLKHGTHRATDFAARYSGAQFAVLLANTPFAGGKHVAERLREAVETLQVPNKRAPSGVVTISIGFACSKIEAEFASEALVAIAEAALKEAKEEGRNCVMGAKNLVDEKVSDDFLKFKRHSKRISNVDTKGHH